MIETQASQTLHGSGVGPLTQLSALARTRAVEVLPVPLVPQNSIAWWTWPVWMALTSVPVTWSWPTMSMKVWGRYLRYRET